MEPDARDLVDDAARGDKSAVDALLARYRGGLEGFVQRRLGGALHAKESAADLAQSACREVLEDLAVSRFEFRGEAEFKQWLYEAALLKIRERRRFWNAEMRDPRREQPVSGGGLARSQTSPSAAAARGEDRERLLRGLEKLAEDERRIVRWAHLEGLSHGEIAQRLSISEGNSRVQLSRALAKLARALEELDAAP